MKKSILGFLILMSLNIQGKLQEVSGTLDPTFGGSGTGFNIINFGGSDIILTLAIDSQGRIVAGGRAAGLDVLIARFTPDGVLDPTFGGNGTGFNIIDFGGSDFIFTLAIDSQGRIVAGGQAGAATDVLIARFTPDGVLDPTFGGNGTGFNIIDFGGTGQIFTLVIDSQGRIVAGGQVASSDVLIARFTPDGLLDTSFGGNGTGFNLINFGGSDIINSLAIDSQGRIVAGGRAGADGDALIARFSQDGTLDPTFGGNGTGFNLIDFGLGFDAINSLAIDSQGRIVAGGRAGASNDVLISSFTPDGLLDTSFGGNGTGFNLIDLGGFDEITSLAIDSQGRIVAGGRAGASNDVLIVRFTPDGLLDPTFGGNGTGFNLINFGGADIINSLAINSQGRIVAGGQAGTSSDVLIARLFNEPLALFTTALREKYCGVINSQ